MDPIFYGIKFFFEEIVFPLLPFVGTIVNTSIILIVVLGLSFWLFQMKKQQGI